MTGTYTAGPFMRFLTNGVQAGSFINFGATASTGEVDIHSTPMPFTVSSNTTFNVQIKAGATSNVNIYDGSFAVVQYGGSGGGSGVTLAQVGDYMATNQTPVPNATNAQFAGNATNSQNAGTPPIREARAFPPTPAPGRFFDG